VLFIFLIGFISTKSTKINRYDHKLLTFYLLFILCGGTSFTLGFNWKINLMMDAGCLVINLGLIITIISIILVGKGCADHTANAGVIYGIIYLIAYLPLVMIDSVGSILFGINEVAPLIYVILPINLICFIYSVIITFCWSNKLLGLGSLEPYEPTYKDNLK
jgi:hypothetical protein